MQQVVRTVERIAASDVTVFITGESGTGKEVIADLVHTLSRAAKTRSSRSTAPPCPAN
jgi:DNA-binding NtrC family response regulator